MTTTNLTYNEKIDICFHEALKDNLAKCLVGASAHEVTQKMAAKGWLSPADTVIDIADLMREMYGPQS